MSLHSDHTWKAFLDDEALTQEFLTKVAPEYLKTKRWYGAKSSLVKKFEIERQLQFPFGDTVVHLLWIEVIFHTANSDTYFVPLAFCKKGDFESDGKIGKAEVSGIKGFLVDAFYVPAFREELFRQIVSDETVDVGDGTLTFEHGKGCNWKPEDGISTRMLSLEQSNTTIVINDQFFLKVYRKMYRDLNPDYEVSRFLTEHTDFRNTPAYAGAITWSKPNFYKVTMGLMQQKVENEGDIWPLFVKQVEAYFRRVEAAEFDPEDLPKVPLYKPVAAEDLPPVYPPFIGERALWSIKQLARRTAEMHYALFKERHDTAFAPIPYSEDYKVWLLNRILYMLDHRITTMENVLDKMSPKARTFAEEFLDRKAEVKNLILNFDESHLNSSRIRIHGDYHLGQVLFTGDDFVILDFEGEPEATIRDRKVKQSPLKDVAGMMRSFHYSVFATIFSEHNFKLDEATLTEFGGRYYRAVVAVFLDTYLNFAFDNGLNIGYYQEVEYLLKYHIFEKAVYELGYELNSRPDWVIIPLKGLNQILNND